MWLQPSECGEKAGVAAAGQSGGGGAEEDRGVEWPDCIWSEAFLDTRKEAPGRGAAGELGSAVGFWV